MVDVRQNLTVRREVQEMCLNVVTGARHAYALHDCSETWEILLCRPSTEMHFAIATDDTVMMSLNTSTTRIHSVTLIGREMSRTSSNW
jgi:hypothetical protein